MLGLSELETPSQSQRNYRALTVGVWALLVFALAPFYILQGGERPFRNFVATSADREALRTLKTAYVPDFAAFGWWHRRKPVFAYSTYATNEIYLCNALMMAARLRELQVQANISFVISDEWSMEEESTIGDMLRYARDDLHVDLWPKPLQYSANDSDVEITWQDSNTKLLQFSLTAYDRVLMLDADSMVMRSLDSLFLAPQADIAAPRAYWQSDTQLNSQMVLATPSDRLWQAAKQLIDTPDRETRYGKHDAMILPHRPYIYLSGILRWDDPSYLSHYLPASMPTESYDPTAELHDAHYVHYSDWPVTKPWKADLDIREKHQPACDSRGPDEPLDCTRRELWHGLYDEFTRRREAVCGRFNMRDRAASWASVE